MSRVRIVLNAAGAGTIEVDGMDMSYVVRGVSFTSEVGRPAMVHLSLIPTEIEVTAENASVKVGDLVLRASQ